MSIVCNIEVKPIADATFKSIDYEIMSFVFDIHRDLGRLYSEKIYQSELAYRCDEMGFDSVVTELQIKVSHRSFIKNYYADLLVNNSILYELKAVSALTGEHHAQLLNYLLLLGLQYGKLLNFRSGSVEHRFVSTTLRSEDRYDYNVDDHGWIEVDDDSIRFRNLMLALIADWGMFLDTNLFMEAITHFLGGQANVDKEIDVVDGSRLLGSQRVHLLNPVTAFSLSSLSRDDGLYERHIRRFLSYTHLEKIHWINFDHHNVTFKTITQN